MQFALTSAEAFERYEAVRHRFPALPRDDYGRDASRQVDDLGALVDIYDVFVFDAYGVLNVGARPIMGACERIQDLRAAGKRLFVLTNAASFDFPQIVQKFKSLGFSFAPDELISSRAVTETALSQKDKGLNWGIIAPSVLDSASLGLNYEILQEDGLVYDAVDAFLFLSTHCWNAKRQQLLIDSLRNRLRPVVVANPDLVAPRETGLSVEPGYFSHDLLDKLPNLELVFHGKPFASVYDRIESLLCDTVSCDRIVMTGDSLHTDIWGARVRGWGSVLVTDHGFLKGQDVVAAIASSGIRPDWIVPSI